MFKSSKICLNKTICTNQNVVVNPPVLSVITPICPFAFYVTCNNASANVAVNHLSTVWSLALDANFTQTVISITTTGEDKNEVLFPKNLIVDGSTYYIKAYFITDLGESVSCSPLQVIVANTSFNYIAELSDINKFQDFTLTKYFIYNNLLHQICYDNVDSPRGVQLKINKYNGTIWEQLLVYDNNKTLTIQKDNFPSFCLDGDNLYLALTMTDTTLLGIYLFKFDLLTNTLTTITSDNTGLFKRDGSAMFVNGEYVYFVGGYELLNFNTLKPPEDTESTFIRMNKTTNVFEEVTLTDTTFRPKNYRGSRVVKVGNDIWLFSGYTSTVTAIVSDISVFSFQDMKWVSKQRFPYMNKLNNQVFDICLSADTKYLNLFALDNLLNSFNLFKFNLDDEYWNIHTTVTTSTYGYSSFKGIKINNDDLYLGVEIATPPPPS